jgi:pimeloyl-ACP methyl ester carboxylesterase
MADAIVNDVRLHYELYGTGEVPLVLVHGSWASHYAWGLIVPLLTPSFRVLTYDRRGYGQSEYAPGQDRARTDVADLAALIEHLELGPVWLVGQSYGAAIAFRLALERADLLRGLIGHEPSLLSLLAADPVSAPMLEDVLQKTGSVLEQIASGDHAGAAEQFIDTVALGPGSWALTPPEFQQVIVGFAAVFLDECSDPQQLVFDLAAIKAFDGPVLLTQGDQSPPFFAPIVANLAAVLSHAEVMTIHGAGHIPHATHPNAYADAITAFVRKNSA